MSKKIWIKKVVLQRTPGFGVGEFPPIEDLTDGLNVIWGPNGVGKSSLSKSLCALLWERKGSANIEAEGTLESPEGPWMAKLDQGVLKQTRLLDNQTTPLPGRSNDLSDSYWFPLHVLLQTKETGETFLAQVKKDMQGGVDLQLACNQVRGKRTWTNASNKASKNLRESLEALKIVTIQQESQKDITLDIAKLEESVNSGATLRKKKTELEQAKQILETRREIQNLEDLMASFPSQVSLVDEKSPARLQELRELVEGKASDLEKELNEQERVKKLYEACAISKTQYDDVSLPEKLQSSLTNWENAKNQVETSQRSWEQETVALQEWEVQHSWIVEKVPQPQKLKDMVVVLKNLANTCEPLRIAVVSGQDYEASLGKPEQETANDASLSSLSVRLGDWMKSYNELEATPMGSVVPKNLKKRVILTGLLGALVILLLSFLHPLASIPGFLVLAGILWKLIPNTKKNNDMVQKSEALKALQIQIEQELATLQDFSLDTWSSDACLALQTALGRQLVENQAVRARNQARKIARGNLEKSQEKLRRWQEAWQEACNDLGISVENPTLFGAEFFHFSEHLKKWADLKERVAVAQSDLNLSKVAYEKARAQLQVILDIQECDIPTLQGNAESLKKRIQKAHELQETLDSRELRIADLQVSLKKQRSAYEEFWKKLEIPFDDEKTLQEVAAVVPRWRDTRQDLQIRKRQEADLVKTSSKAESLAAEMVFEDVVDQIETLSTQLGELENARQKLGALQNQYAHLLDGSEMATAMLSKKEAEQALEVLRQQETLANVIGLLTERLSEQAQKVYQPQVLVTASEWMKRITQGRYTLSVNDEGFFALDTVQTKAFKLDELSSGTRVQLLFAVRMAFIESLELSSGLHFPIFLDELLANSDEKRAMAIAQAIKEIATDRQVFYFTAQRDEVEKLRSLEVESFHEIALYDLKRKYALDKSPRPIFTYTKPEVPSFDADYERYGQVCEVPGPSLWEPIEKLHSWYLETDSERLKNLLLGGLTQIGQVITTLGAKDSVLKHRYDLLEKGQKLAREGRCKTLRASDLEDEDLKLSRKPQYWKQIVDLVSENNLDGNALLEATDTKAVTRFNAENRQILSDWLYEHQFATSETPYSKEAILDKLYAADPTFTIDSEDRLVVQRWLDGIRI
ncbi:hypothetical protein [uncultured Sphaerochaeta sp.]|uniref:hypothetical protein n=1 Tax=uncultured Sphaerochaeta sp. TaxID=886478 RepID=UPI002A0A8CA1|nr:hypothetical protein [uncultured Sphaerochaeta sp.]